MADALSSWRFELLEGGGGEEGRMDEGGGGPMTVGEYF